MEAAASGLVEFESPDLLLIETAHVFLKAARRGVLTEEQATAAYQAVGEIDIRMHRTPLFPNHLVEWATRELVTAYDLAFVDLAQRLGLPIVSGDEVLGRKISKLLTFVSLSDIDSFLSQS